MSGGGPGREPLLTPDGFRRLSAELAELTGARRREVAEELQRAGALAGDAGDNVELLEARRDQELLEQRIAALEACLASARVVDAAAPRGVAALGAEVCVEDPRTGRRDTYRLVGSPESAPSEGLVSVESPVGSALLGHRSGDLVEVDAPRRRRRLRIVRVSSRGRRRR